MRAIAVVVGSALVALACEGTMPSPATGLTGIVTRGPVTPVCRVDVPCDAPFTATFTVRRGGTQVATFRSDATGQFTVLLAPGPYVVVPSADAPIMSPGSQVKPVIVADTGTLTVVQLSFDTGIR